MKARAEEAEAKQKSQDDEKKRRDEELSMTQKISQGITTALRMAGVVAPLPHPGAAGNPGGNMMNSHSGAMGSARTGWRTGCNLECRDMPPSRSTRPKRR